MSIPFSRMMCLMHSYICLRSPLIYKNLHESMSIFKNGDFHWSLKLNKGILLSTGHAVFAHKLYVIFCVLLSSDMFDSSPTNVEYQHTLHFNRIRIVETNKLLDNNEDKVTRGILNYWYQNRLQNWFKAFWIEKKTRFINFNV